MTVELSNIKWLQAGLTLVAALSLNMAAVAADAPKTAQEFAQRYMAAFNAKDVATLHKLQYPSATKSEMQQMLDQMTEGEMSAGTKYDKFELLPAPADMEKAALGPDGFYYKPNLKPTNLLKMTSVTKDGTASTSFPIGAKNGIYYAVSIVSAQGEAPAYVFGWQRFTAPQSNWSVMLPNEPEPGRAALEQQGGKEALKNPDIYGVIQNTASIKTSQNWFICGEEGKRRNAPENKEDYRAARTTYAPETLKEWFSDPKKNLDDAVESAVRQNEGKLVQQKDIDLNGSPGRAYEVRNKDGSLSLGRVYWINNALYELSFESKKEKPDSAGADKFLSSLEVH